MDTTTKILAVLGTVWTGAALTQFFAYFYVLRNGDPMGDQYATVASIAALMLLTFQRLFMLRVWALVVTCVFCWSMVTLMRNDQRWTLCWSLAACLCTALLILNWGKMKASL